MTQALTQPFPAAPTDTLDRADLIVALGCEPARDWKTLSEPQVQARAEESSKRYFELQQAQRDALSPKKLTTAFLPILVIKQCLGVAERLEPHVPAMKTMPGVKPERLTVRELALGLWHADTMLNYATQSVSDERLLADEGKPLRESIFKWGDAMVMWEVFTEEEFKKLVKGTSRDDLATDLKFIGDRCVEHWDKLDERVTFTLADAKRAQVVGTRLLTALAARGKPGTGGIERMKDEHRRAFTLLARSIDEFRCGLAWLHRDDEEFDLDAVCPSIHSVRRNATPKPAAKAPVDAT